MKYYLSESTCTKVYRILLIHYIIHTEFYAHNSYVYICFVENFENWKGIRLYNI